MSALVLLPPLTFNVGFCLFLYFSPLSFVCNQEIEQQHLDELWEGDPGHLLADHYQEELCDINASQQDPGIPMLRIENP